MPQKSEFHLDILIKKEEGYYSAHCLQFDLVATDDTLQRTLEAIKNLCIAHIENSIENRNMEFLFSPAPKEVWAKYSSSLLNQRCKVKQENLLFASKSRPYFHIQSCYA
jgi:hypothetical protein